ncbi:MAG: hypothetical protein QM809_15380 [Gordonia sp. (in: high G+C Gram-positive bacteria)]|uniref:hypothetical protein n=1 Tax=Gordonia sp. (in: high G+C Gram-positive bacteria) TaxID=84139 RepID=UPI0039E45629
MAEDGERKRQTAGLARLPVSLRSAKESSDLAAGTGGADFDPSDLAEAQFIAGRVIRGDDPHLARHLREKELAQFVLNAVVNGTAWATDVLEENLPRAFVTALRMGPVTASCTELDTVADRALVDWDEIGRLTPVDHDAVGGVPVGADYYLRTRYGMSLADSAPEVWSSARGYWHMAMDTEYLVPTRFGYAPYVFKVDGWATCPSEPGRSPRVWATGGSLIDVTSGKLRRMEETVGADAGWLPSVADDGPAASSEDLDVARLITGRVIGLGKGANPVKRLRSRTRRLSTPALRKKHKTESRDG